MKKLSSIFAKNRTEELPDDLSGKFVLPLNYEDNNLLNFSKSTIVLGGRGSGKTMFLKYHCFPTIFSNKKIIQPEDFKNIGIYWRPDTDFANMITEQYLGDRWKSIFETYVGLSIFSEFSKMLNLLAQSSYKNKKDILAIQTTFIPNDISSILNIRNDVNMHELSKICQAKRSELNDWLNYPTNEPPITFAAKSKIINFINFTIKTLSPFNESTFHIFIDEFENLHEKQQIIINTWIKHSEEPLIFHIAYKKHSEVPSQTSGLESIVDVNDYRKIDLEKLYENDFEILASEIILSKIYDFYKCDFKHNLNKIDDISKRKDTIYQDEIKKNVKKIFPSLSLEQTVETLYEDLALVKKLKEMISQGLKNKKSNLSPDKFINNDFKQESLINAVLLHRKNKKPEEILEKFENHDVKYYEPLINNNLLGSILYIYSAYQNKICPYYGGFERFILLSQSNIRHLLELCYQSIIEYELNSDKEIISIEALVINVVIQAKAAKITSKTQIEKISSLGRYGKDLLKITNRLGKIFLLSQKRPSQSIAEITQFSLHGYELNEHDNPEATVLINECKVWGILEETTNNKVTTHQDNSINLFILHPIFSPFFGISPRKKRKIDLSYKEFGTIFLESESEFQKLYKSYISKWDIEDNNENYSLLDFTK